MSKISDKYLFEIRSKLEATRNKRKQIGEIRKKLDKLEEHLNRMEASIQKDEMYIANLGSKDLRKDGKPETSEEIEKKINYNRSLAEEKLSLIEKLYPEFYQEFQSLLPKSLSKLESKL